MNDRIANDLIRYAELVEDGALISPEEMNCASLMRIAAEALAQPAVALEHEPVAIRHSFDGYGYLYTDMGFGSGWVEWTKRSHKDAEPLYTTPPQHSAIARTAAEGEDTQRAWVELTNEDIEHIIVSVPFAGEEDYEVVIRAAITKFKEKNA